MRVSVGHLPQHFESLKHIARSETTIRRDHRAMAMQARAWLRSFRNAACRLLIGKHVGMPASVPIVDREGVSGKHAFQPGITLDLLLRQRFGAAELSARRVDGSLIAVVLAGPVDRPRR